MSSSTTGRMRTLITGASRGIGRATALVLSQNSEEMILVSRSASGLRETALGCDCSTKVIQVDLADQQQRKPLIKLLEESAPPITCVVYCAGDGLPRKFEHLTIGEMQHLQELHVYALIEIVQAVLPGMKSIGEGRIITIGSLASLRPQAYMTAYAASKAAMRTAMQCIADEVITSGITVNIVSPGSVDTDLGNTGRSILAELSGRSIEQLNAERSRHLSTPSLISPNDIAEVIRFLCSSSTRALAGQDIVVAGTLIMR